MAEQDVVDILVTDDDISTAEIIVHAVRLFHPSVTLHCVTNGIEALKYIDGEGETGSRAPAKAPKLILLDLNMPLMNGFTLLEKLKADPRTEKIPVVVFTSSDEPSDLVKARQLKADEYVVKPVRYEEFALAIERIVTKYILKA